MVGLYSMAVALAFFLSAGNTADAVDPDRLALLVDGILREYRTQNMFSLAVRIPYNQNQNINQILQQVFISDPGNNVKHTIDNGDVYIGKRVVAAEVQFLAKGANHAESRVLDHLFSRTNANDNDMLLFYVYASPCVEKCSNDAHDQRILTRITQITQWNSYAVVFSKIFTPRTGPGNTDNERRGALQRLGRSVGLNNIFRCDIRGWMQCTRCSSGTPVANYCVAD